MSESCNSWKFLKMLHPQTIHTINQLDNLNKNTANFTADFMEPIFAGLPSAFIAAGIISPITFFLSYAAFGIPASIFVKLMGNSYTELMSDILRLGSVGNGIIEGIRRGRNWYHYFVDYYHASGFDNQIKAFAESNLQHIYPITKTLCFENADKVSVEELEKLYQLFRTFCSFINEFNANDTNDHHAFLNYVLDQNNKEEFITILIKLGVDPSDIEEKDARRFAFHGKNSLTWLAAKVVGQNYTPQLDDNNLHGQNDDEEFVKRAVGNIVQSTKLYS